MTTKSKLSLAFLIASSLCTGAAFAGDDASKEGRHGKVAMAMVDTNQDGKVSQAEYSAHSQKMFEKADTNKDGKVTAQEMDAAHAAMQKQHAGMKHDDMHREGMKSDDMKDDHRGMSSADMIKKADTDGDGALTRAEHTASAQQMFSNMDANKDGNLTDAEMKASHKRKMSAMSDE